MVQLHVDLRPLPLRFEAVGGGGCFVSRYVGKLSKTTRKASRTLGLLAAAEVCS